MFAIEMLPAAHGDCLWIEYGKADSPSYILIDGGTSPTFGYLQEKFESLPEASRRVELLVVTHIDADHIEGAVKLLGALTNLGVQIDDVWFNGREQMEKFKDEEPPKEDKLGALQGEFLSTLIKRRALKQNNAFSGEPIYVTDTGPLPKVTLAGGMEIVILSPDEKQLMRLKEKWKQEILDAGLDPENEEEVLAALAKNRKLAPEDDRLGSNRTETDISKLAAMPFKQDTAVPNGSSIAFLATFDGKTALFTGDAYPTVLLSSLERLEPEDRISVEVFKIPHHGSMGNLSPALLKKLDCPTYLVSTNGAVFKHPDRESVARIVSQERPGKGPIEVKFNYKTEFNSFWDSEQEQDKRGYSATYPKENGDIVRIALAE